MRISLAFLAKTTLLGTLNSHPNTNSLYLDHLLLIGNCHIPDFNKNRAVCGFVGHINNLNNTCIWKLVQLKGLTTAEAQQRINVSSDHSSFSVACSFYICQSLWVALVSLADPEILKGGGAKAMY